MDMLRHPEDDMTFERIDSVRLYCPYCYDAMKPSRAERQRPMRMETGIILQWHVCELCDYRVRLRTLDGSLTKHIIADIVVPSCHCDDGDNLLKPLYHP